MQNTPTGSGLLALFGWLLVGALLLSLLQATQIEAGGKGKKKGSEDIILYRGNIVMRGEKGGESIVLADNHGHGDHVEESMDFMPFMYPYQRR